MGKKGFRSLVWAAFIVLMLMTLVPASAGSLEFEASPVLDASPLRPGAPGYLQQAVVDLIDRVEKSRDRDFEGKEEEEAQAEERSLRSAFRGLLQAALDVVVERRQLSVTSGTKEKAGSAGVSHHPFLPRATTSQTPHLTTDGFLSTTTVQAPLVTEALDMLYEDFLPYVTRSARERRNVPNCDVSTTTSGDTTSGDSPMTETTQETTFTTLPSTTPASNPCVGSALGSATLGQACGNSTTIFASCSVANSACVRNNSTTFVCKCAGGYVTMLGNSKSCGMAPASVLAAGTSVLQSVVVDNNVGSGSSVVTMPLLDLSSYEDAVLSANLLPLSSTFEADVTTGRLEVKVTDNNALTLGVTNMVVTVQARMADVTVQSVVLLQVTVRPSMAKTEVVLLADGSAEDTVVVDAASAIPGFRSDNYSFTDTTRLFYLDASSGRVTTKSRVNVTALNTSNIPLTWETRFDVRAKAQNREFTVLKVHVVVFRPTLVTSVSETATIGMTVVQGGPFIDNQAQLPPALRFDNSDIVLGQRLDYDEGSRSISFEVNLQVGSRTTTTDIVVNVINENDNPPVIERTVSPVVAAGSVPGTLVAALEARDLDGDALTYSLLPGPYDTSFTISSRGVLSSSVLLTRGNFDGQSSFSIEVSVSDGSNTVTRTVQVDIENAQPNSTSLGRIFNANMSESRPPAYLTSVFDANYTKYEFLGSQPNFRIDPRNGVVETTQELDRETYSSLSLVITVVKNDSEDCTLIMLGTLEVTVLDVNDNDPSFIQFPNVVDIVEEEANRRVVDLAGRDKDAGLNSRLTFSLEGPGSTDFNVTRTGDKTAVVKTQSRLDRETTASYQLKVVVTDGGSPSRSATASLTVSVRDKNDNPPVLTSASVTVPENSQSSFALQLTYSDRDNGTNSQADLRVEGEMFEVNASNFLLLKAGEVLDRETSSSYNVTLIAVDKGLPRLTGTGSVIITLTDENDNDPRFISRSLAQVSEDDSCTAPFFYLNATDPDEGNNGTVTFSACTNAPSAPFTVQSDGGVRCTLGRLDYEQEEQRLQELCVEARDQGSPTPRTVTTTLTLQLLDVNDNGPLFGQAAYSLNVSSAVTGPGQPLLVVSATDADSGDNGKVTFRASGTNANRFRVDDSSGLVQVGVQSLDAGDYSFQVEARDSGTPSRSSTVSVEVSVSQGASSVIFTPQSYTFNVSEGTSPNTPISQITALHADTYSILGVPSILAIDNRGTLTLNAALDRETQSSYLVVVQAKSNNGDIGLAKVEVEVLDENDNSPVFAPTTLLVEVAEDATEGHLVVQVEATDADSGSNGMLEFSLSSSNGAFTINETSGEVTVLRELDHETTSTYSLDVRVSDRGTPRRQANKTLTIDVTDVNDNAPIITLDQTIANVEEDTDLSETVLTGSFRDADGFNTNSFVTLKVLQPCPVSVGSYDRNSKSSRFDLRLTEKLDYEEAQKTFSCLLVATNDRSNIHLNSSVSFTVNVQDVNDNAPVFENAPFHVNLSREAVPGFLVLPSPNVTDRDEGANGRFTFSLEGANSAFFSVDTENGTIRVSQSQSKGLLFSEEEVQLFLIATNPVPAASPSVHNFANATVNIKILDGNVSPSFERDQEANVTEEVEPSAEGGTLLATLQAKDRVEGRVGSCVCNYSILETQPQGAGDLIELRPQSGGIGAQLFLMAKLDRENPITGDTIRVVVIANDDGEPSKTGTTTFTLYVADINDNGPMFQSPLPNLVVKQNAAPGTTIYPPVNATDPDFNPVTKYELVKFISTPNISNPFTINGSTGHLVVNGSLVNPDLQNIVALVTVKATDPENGRNDLASVQVDIEFVNDNKAPTFNRRVYTSALEIDAKAGTQIVVGDFVVTDPDGDNVTVEIIRGNVKDFVGYDAATGLFSLKNSLDTCVVWPFNLTLEARDFPKLGRSLSRTSIAYLIIERQREEDSLVCQLQSSVDRRTAERTNYIILFAVFCTVTAVLLLLLIFVTYKWRVSVHEGSDPRYHEPSPYTSIGASQESARSQYSTLGIQNPTFTFTGAEEREDLKADSTTSPYLRISPEDQAL